MHSIKYLHLPHRTGARVSHVAVVDAGRQRAQPARVRRRVADRVQDLHVADVVDVKGLFEAYYQPLEYKRVKSKCRQYAIYMNGKNRVINPTNN